jgi:LruC domain-containing protein
MTKRLLTILVVTSVAVTALGLTKDPKTGRWVWTFQGGTYKTAYDGTGIPLTFDQVMSIPQSFLDRLTKALPEGQSVPNTDPSLIASDVTANLHLSKDAKVWVTFIHEGAGYRNSFGYFTYPDGSVPATTLDVHETIVFPNSSFYNSGGDSKGLYLGDTVYLGQFTAGTNLGFMVAANGFDATNGVSPTQDPNWIFYTLRALNPETPDALKAHTVLLDDTATGMIALGMEDMNRNNPSCDHDFNDIIFSISSDPVDAIDRSGVVAMPTGKDTDGDGVDDASDEFPTDPRRAFTDYYPSKGGIATLAFEDDWPTQGDYDMNDLVVRYQFSTVVSATGLVRDVDATFTLVARGAGKHNGMGIAFPGLTAASVASATLNVAGAGAVAATPEAGQAGLVFQLFGDAYPYTAPVGSCDFYNTEPGCYGGAGTTFELKMTFAGDVSPATLGAPPYNPFLFRTGQRGLEIHLPGHSPTTLADATLFHTSDDDSDVAAGRSYVTKRNLPWALDLPVAWAYPLERQSILAAYPDFATWAQSGGVSAKDWYGTDVDAANVWAAPAK